MKSFFIGVGVVILLALIVVGGYLGGWWLQKDTINRQNRIDRHSYEVQQTYREKVIDAANTVADIDVQIADPSVTQEQKDALEAQRRAVVTQGCDNEQRISGERPSQVAEFASKECGR